MSDENYYDRMKKDDTQEKYLIDIIRANVDNENLTDAEFREFVRRTID